MKHIITSEMLHPDVIFIRSNDGKIDLLSVTHRDDQRGTGNTLVFTKYGDQYFLHEILCPRCGMDVALPNSKHEKLARTRLEAGLLTPSDVYLALK